MEEIARNCFVYNYSVGYSLIDKKDMFMNINETTLYQTIFMFIKSVFGLLLGFRGPLFPANVNNVHL